METSFGYLYVLKNFLDENKADPLLIKRTEKLINDADFKYLYCEKERLFSIGFDIQSNKLSDSYYDFLASEARQTSFVAIAKKDIKYKHWINLGRTLTTINGYKGLVSWSGTAFEYTMPNLIMEIPRGSLIDEAVRFAKRSQIKYANKKGIPWGISESAYSLKDLQGNYQYKAFGIPWLGLKRGLDQELVVSPYGTILFLEYGVEDVVQNLKKIEKLGMRGKYGFYDSIDFTNERMKRSQKFIPVKTYMAHHQGLILNSINNILNNNILKERFMKNPEIDAVKVLLNERMPETVVLTKDSRDKKVKGNYINNYEDKEIVYNNKEYYKRFNSISSDKYTNIINNNGQGYSKCGNIQINRYRNRKDIKEGIGIYFKNLQTKKIWSSFESDNVIFSQSKNEFIKREENIKTNIKVFLSPEKNAEIRQIEIKNYGILESNIEVYICFEPLLSRLEEDIAHPVYNNMFLKFEYLKTKGILLCTRKTENKNFYLGIRIIKDDDHEMEFEIDKERFLGRNTKIPLAVLESEAMSSEIIETIDPIIALKNTILVKPDEQYNLDFIMCYSEDRQEIIDYLDEFTIEKAENILQLAKAKSEEELKFLSINGEKIEYYQKILGHLQEQDIPKTSEYNYNIEEIWKFGISGDNPIILAEVKNTEEVYLVEELLEAIEFFNVKNLRFDLCILDGEKTGYQTFLRDRINEIIISHRLEFLKEIQIFILNKNELSKNDLDAIEDVSNIKFKGTIGGIKYNLDEIEKNKIKKQEKKNYYQQIESIPIVTENLKFDNEIGGFLDKEYIININKDSIPPRTWCNVISNKEFGTITTDNSGGYSWLENSRLKRITSWENDPINDFKSEQIIMKDLDKKVFWNFASDPYNNSYQVRYGMGYSKYIQENDDLLQENLIFVPIDEKLKVNHLSIKNKSKDKKRISIYYALNFSMGEERIKNFGKIKIQKNKNCIEIENICKSRFKEKIEITASEKIASYSNNINDFFEELMEPVIGIEKNKLESKGNILLGNELVIEIPVEIEPFERKDINILMGINANKFTELSSVEKLIENVFNYWANKTDILKVKTPSEKLNIYLNSWLIYQTISSRINAKTGFYQSGGAIGFRDQLQDTLGMKWIDSNLLHYQIIDAAKHQFKEGDVMHWWHKENQTGIRTKMSDDLLWLPYSVLEYIDFTGNFDILEKKVEYVYGIEILDEKEKYDKYYYTKEKENIYEHCIKAIQKSLEFGENGFPKIGTGDWNDGFSNIGKKGKGESIWLGFFLYDILTRWRKILEIKGEKDKIEKYENIRKDLKKNLNTKGWDGDWFKRAINDEGMVIGSKNAKECKIDSISQSWSVISEAADNDKKYMAMESVKKHLVDKENQLIKLLLPPFTGESINPGYIQKYPEGVRENGGQYTHASIWVIMALCMLGMLDDAVELIEMINPISHTENRIGVNKYKIEPYVISGDIYANKYMPGRGGWSWYTGSSSWYYKVCIEYILGLKRQGDKLYLPKRIPNKWNKFEIQYRYKSNLYNIKVEKMANLKGKAEIMFNGKKINEDFIELKDENKIENIEIKI